MEFIVAGCVCEAVKLQLYFVPTKHVDLRKMSSDIPDNSKLTDVCG